MEYQICGPWEDATTIRRKVKTNNYGGYRWEYFAGYDFMGSVIWEKDFSFDHAMPLEESRQILKDLTAAGEEE